MMKQELIIKKKELPEEWKFIQLSEVIESIGNGTSYPQNSDKKGLKITRIETISFEKVDLKRTGYVDNNDPDFIKKYRLKVGEILFSNINSVKHIGKTAIYEEEKEVLLHGMNLLRIVPNKKLIVPKFLLYFLRDETTRRYYKSICRKAINQASLNQKDIQSVLVSLPPLPIQQKIVSKLDRQMTQIEMMKKEAEKEKKKSNLLFQSVLSKLFSEYEQHKKWITLQDATTKISKGSTPTSYGHAYTNEGPPFIRAEDVLGNKVDLEKCQFHISEETHDFLKRSKLKEGDVLITIAGTLGRVGYIGKIVEANCNQAVCFLRPKKGFKTKFIVYCLQSHYILAKILNFKVGGGIPNLNMGDISKISIPFLSIEEQEQFINLVEKEKEKIENIVGGCLIQCESINQLPSSILNEVFGQYEIPEDV